MLLLRRLGVVLLEELRSRELEERRVLLLEVPDVRWLPLEELRPMEPEEREELRPLLEERRTPEE